jgi:hypothetical protein
MRARYFTSPFGDLLAAGVHLCHDLGVEVPWLPEGRISTSLVPDIELGITLSLDQEMVARS